MENDIRAHVGLDTGKAKTVGCALVRDGGEEVELHLRGEHFAVGTLASIIPMFQAVDGFADADLTLLGMGGDLHFDGDMALQTGFDIEFRNAGNWVGAYEVGVDQNGFTFVNAVTPEPGSVLLLGLGLSSLGVLARKRRKRA